MKMNTNTVLIIGAAAVGVYLLTRPKVGPQYPYSIMNPSGYGNPALSNPYGAPVYGSGGYVAPGNTTAGIITAGGSALQGLSDLIGNFF
jgi:hypothetical protein